MKTIKIYIVILTCILGWSVSAQDIDSSSVIASALVQNVNFTKGVWKVDDLSALIVARDVSLQEVASRGLKNVFFFRLLIPKYGIVIDSLDRKQQKTYDPFLTEPEITFGYDLITNKLYNLSVENDLKVFRVIVLQRLAIPIKNIFKRRTWKSNVFIEGVDMERLRTAK